MAEESTSPTESQPSVTEITFNIKSSSDTKHVVTVPETMSVLELKQKLAASDFAGIPAERQRLIYSGRVLKDADPLSNYKIKDGNTVHMVKSAASQQQQASSQTASSASTNTPSAQSNPAASGVPQNLAAGTGNDPLAGLTGARYAGFAQMPSASNFGADGGMNPAANPEDFMRMLENPMFQSEMNEAMNNPDVIRMMQNMPQFRDNPMLRQMLENPEFRRMMTDPQFIRQSLQMGRLMGGGMGGFGGGMGGAGGAGEAGGMPAPGVTDNTPQQEGAAAQQQQQQQSQTGNSDSIPGAGVGAGAGQANPFAGMGMGMGMGMGGAGAQGNPFAQLFGGAGSPFNNPNAAGSPPANSDPNTTSNDQNSNAQANPLGDLRSLMNLEALMRGGNQQGGNAQLPDWLQGMAQGTPQQPQQPQDTRPPEEVYESQLRQLNDMGFFEFERNVRALRMSGGNVQGAIEYLLSDS